MDFEENLKKISDTGFETFLAKHSFKLSDNDISTVNFLFWFIYYVERKLTEIEKSVLKEKINDSDGSYSRAVDNIFRELHFLGKINVLARGNKNKEIKSFCDYLLIINDMRNALFHGRVETINDILYENVSIGLRATKEKMLKDFRNRLQPFGSLK